MSSKNDSVSIEYQAYLQQGGDFTFLRKLRNNQIFRKMAEVLVQFS